MTRTWITGAGLAGLLAMLGGCDSPRNGGLLCQNAANQLEPCCVDQTGSYKACSAIGGGAGPDATAGSDATGGSDAALGPDGEPTSDASNPGNGDSTGPDDVGGTGDTGSTGKDTFVEPQDTGTGDDGSSCQVCEPGASKCKDTSTRLVCVEDGSCSGWQSEPCGADTACVGGMCVSDACDVDSPCDEPEARSCSGDVVLECAPADGVSCWEWVTVETCDGGTACVAGECVETFECPEETECPTAGARICGSAAEVLTCKPAPGDATCLQWTETEACTDDLECVGGACVPSGLDCRGFIDCTSACDGNEACAEVCEEDATGTALQQYVELDECASAECNDVVSVNGFQACFYSNCKPQVLGCENLVTLGPGSCSDLLSCAAECPSGDWECIGPCWDSVDYEAHQLALNMLACPDENCAPFYTPGTTAFQQCAEEHCTEATAACKTD